MRGDLLQGPGRGQSGCLQALDDPLDFSQACLEGVDLLPKAVQFLGKDFALAASGSHDGESDLIPALPRGRGAGRRAERPPRKRFPKPGPV
jgi:hypothetical protein